MRFHYIIFLLFPSSENEAFPVISNWIRSPENMATRLYVPYKVCVYVLLE